MTPGRVVNVRAGPRRDFGVSPNAAGFVDAACVRYYRVIRDGVQRDSRQIGYGVNKWPLLPPVRRQLIRLYAHLLASRVAEYDCAEDTVHRALIADIAGRYLGASGLAADHVVLCHGTTEAISIVMGYARLHRLRPTLPLPVYYAFEQSAARMGLPTPAYYGVTGACTGSGGHQPGLFVDVAPNGVLGTWVDPPGGVSRGRVSQPRLRLVDHVFTLPTFQPTTDFAAALARRCADLTDTVVCLTPSKDLSVPGLRCGVIITRNPELVGFARADRFERGYAAHANLGSIAATHLALLLLNGVNRAEVAAQQQWLAARFAGAGLPFLSAEEVVEFREQSRLVREVFLRNLDELDRWPFLLPVAGAERPVAGYSSFRWLGGFFGSAEAFTAWVRRAGAGGLKLNPNYLFGGDPAVWSAVYPDRYGIRLNLSVAPGQLKTDLTLLESLLPP